MKKSERELLDRFFVVGVDAFRSDGYTDDEAATFLQRPDVQSVVKTYLSNVQNTDVIDAVRQHTIRQQLAKLAPLSVNVLAKGLVGPKYSKHPDGSVMLDKHGHPKIANPEPTRNQIATARDVLDRLGVDSGGASTHKPAVNVNVLIPKSDDNLGVEIQYDSEDVDSQVLSRERMRNAMLKLTAGAVSAGHAEVRKRIQGRTDATEKKREGKGTKATEDRGSEP